MNQNTMTTVDIQTKIGKSRTVKKLLAFAFDPSARMGESVNAATRAVEVRGPPAFLSMTFAGNSRRRMRGARRKSPVACDIQIPFGKFKNRTLREIGRLNIGYLRWLREECTDPEISEAAAITLQWIMRGGGA